MLREVHHANAVGRLVGLLIVVIVIIFTLLKNGVAFGVEFRRRGDWSTTECDIKLFSIRAGAQAARTLAYGKSRDDLVVLAVNDRELTGFFIRNIDAKVGFGGVGREEKAERSEHSQR